MLDRFLVDLSWSPVLYKHLLAADDDDGGGGGGESKGSEVGSEAPRRRRSTLDRHGLRPTLEDLRELDSVFAASLDWILSNDIT